MVATQLAITTPVKRPSKTYQTRRDNRLSGYVSSENQLFLESFQQYSKVYLQVVQFRETVSLIALRCNRTPLTTPMGVANFLAKHSYATRFTFFKSYS